MWSTRSLLEKLILVLELPLNHGRYCTQVFSLTPETVANHRLHRLQTIWTIEVGVSQPVAQEKHIGYVVLLRKGHQLTGNDVLEVGARYDPSQVTVTGIGQQPKLGIPSSCAMGSV